MAEQKVHQEHIQKDQPKAVALPSVGQQNHNNWKVHTERVNPQVNQANHVIAPQIDARNPNFTQPAYNQRRPELLQEIQRQQLQQQRHWERPSGNQSLYPRYVQPQFAYPVYGDPRHFYQPRFQNPYDGLKNFWSEDCDDNYYNGPYRRDNDRDDFIPRVIEGILGGILTGAVINELDKEESSVDKSKQYSDDVENNDDSDQGETFERASKVELSPEQQLQTNLDFIPQGQASGTETRFERTG